MRKLIVPMVIAFTLGGSGSVAFAQQPSTAPAAPQAQSDGMKKSESSAIGTQKLVVTTAQGEKWVNKRVYSQDGSDIGEIASFVSDSDGNVEYFHTDIGGFLGIGETSVQVKPDQFEMREDKVYLSLSKEEALQLPRIKE